MRQCLGAIVRVTLRVLLCSVPAACLLAACGYLPQPFASNPPSPPPPPVSGAFVAPPGTAAPEYSGSSTAPAAAPGAAVRLSASDALALLANNTAIGVTDNGVPYGVFFTNDGVARLREPSLADTGTWRVLPDGQVCSQLPHVGSGAENCYVLERYGDVILFGRPDGPALGSIRVVAGNPQML